MQCFSLMFIVWLKLQTIFWFQIRNAEGIINGQIAKHDQFKYMVSVQANGEHICGGAIVSPQHVATAAHCFFDNDNNFINKRITVVARIINLVLDKVPSIEVGVSAIYVSKEYVRIKRVPNILFYEEIGDLAILELKELFPLSEHLDVLSLPKVDNNLNQLKYVNAPTMLTGFGQSISPGNGTGINQDITNILNEKGVHLRFMESLVRNKNSVKTQFPIEIHNKFIIAASNKAPLMALESPCYGDGGSPLVYNGMLIGVLAQHWNDCNDRNLGSIYTRISDYKSSIRETMNKSVKLHKYMFQYNEQINNAGQITWQMFSRQRA